MLVQQAPIVRLQVLLQNKNASIALQDSYALFYLNPINARRGSTVKVA